MGIFQKTDAWLRMQNPWVTLGLTLLSIAVAVLLFIKDQKTGTVAFGSISVKVYDTANSDEAISVVTRDGEKIEGQVYVIETSISNKGDFSLTEGRKRRPLVLSFEPSAKIIDARISAATDPQITNFQLQEVSEPGKPRRFRLAWDHFDPGHGVRITAIATTSGKEIYSVLEGQFLGVEIVRGKLSKPEDEKDEKNSWLPKWAVGILWVVGGLAAIYGTFYIVIIAVYKIAALLNPGKTEEQISTITGRALVGLIAGLMVTLIGYITITHVSVPYIR